MIVTVERNTEANTIKVSSPFRNKNFVMNTNDNKLTEATGISYWDIMGMIELAVEQAELYEESARVYTLECLIETDDLVALVDNCFHYDNSLELYYTEEIEDFFSNYRTDDLVMDIFRKIYHGDFSPYDDYIGFDGYDNFVTYSEFERNAMLEENKAEIIETALIVRNAEFADIDDIIAKYVGVEV